MLSEQTAYEVLWREKHFADEVMTKGPRTPFKDIEFDLVAAK